MRITITGSGFDYGCTGGQSGRVYFGGIAAGNAPVSDGAATAVAPTHAARVVYVTVADCLCELFRANGTALYTYLSTWPRDSSGCTCTERSRERQLSSLSC